MPTTQTRKETGMKTNSKEWIQYMAASGMVASGIVLAFLSFFINGDVVDGVLWYIAQALAFAGGVFGVSIYFRTKLGEAKTEIKDMVERTVEEAQRKREEV